MSQSEPETTPDAMRYGYGRQTHGSRKGLGGDLPNDPARRATHARVAADETDAQAASMENEGQGQTPSVP